MGKETIYYQRQFKRREWRGRNRTELVTGICTFSRERICREQIEPPSIELKIVEKEVEDLFKNYDINQN